jgi:3-mercaptopyruvate sulfurtransferase SseA
MATQALQALGFNARNYRGSWHEYATTDLPLET